MEIDSSQSKELAEYLELRLDDLNCNISYEDLLMWIEDYINGN